MEIAVLRGVILLVVQIVLETKQTKYAIYQKNVLRQDIAAEYLTLE